MGFAAMLAEEIKSQHLFVIGNGYGQNVN